MTDRIKKLLMSIAALAALAAGGAAYAGAQGSGGNTPTPAPAAESETGTAADPADTNGGTEKADANEGADKADKQDETESKDAVTGDALAKATAAALAAVPGGKVGDVSAEQQDAGKADTPEPGDTPDPAYQSQIAYDVEVAKSDGTAVTVHLDKAFAVLGTTKEEADGNNNDGENAQN
jgi:hypothetical protein